MSEMMIVALEAVSFGGAIVGFLHSAWAVGKRLGVVDDRL